MTILAAAAAIACAAAVGGPQVAGTPTADGVWPVDRPRVVEPYAPPEHDWLAGHRGVDLAVAVGQPVRSMVDGAVAFAGQVAGRPVVVVRLPDGRRTTYEPVHARVTVGETVRAGQVLGVVAAGQGHCPAACLHVGLRTATGYADPLSLVGRRPAVLKPL